MRIMVLALTLFIATAYAGPMGVTVSNASNTVVTMSCANCADSSSVQLLPMEKHIFDCMLSGLIDSACSLQYVYTSADGKTMQGGLNTMMGTTYSITNGTGGLVFAMEP
ncbi:MAG: hypothetical protein GY777_16290 [Candidatus Brocadiaceae bacterium]|nr:hypothetical protein [Candidatus Brocadiaceae bacterium]